MLTHRPDFLSVHGHQGHAGRNASACTGTSHTNPSGVHSMFVSVEAQPDESRVGVFDCGRAANLGRETVIDRRDGDAQRTHQGDVRGLVHQVTSQDHAAAMHPEQCRSESGDASRTVDAHRHRVTTRCAGHHHVVYLQVVSTSAVTRQSEVPEDRGDSGTQIDRRDEATERKIRMKSRHR